MLLFFNQEIIKDLDKKNEYLFIFNVWKRNKMYLRKKKSIPDFLSFCYFLIIRQVSRYRQRQIGRSYL
jgi:hypothetical protein